MADRRHAGCPTQGWALRNAARLTAMGAGALVLVLRRRTSPSAPGCAAHCVGNRSGNSLRPRDCSTPQASPPSRPCRCSSIVRGVAVDEPFQQHHAGVAPALVASRSCMLRSLRRAAAAGRGDRRLGRHRVRAGAPLRLGRA